LAKVILAGGTQQQQARRFAKISWWCGFREQQTGFCVQIARYWIQWILNTIWKWRKRWRKEYCTESPRYTTFWRCGRAARIYLLHRRHLALNTSRCQPLNTFSTRNRSSKPPGHSFTIMVRLHSNCPEDHLCHQLCLQRTSMEDELKSWMSAESWESTVIQLNATRIVHQKAFLTPNCGQTGMATWIILMTSKTIAQQTLNPM
jgi:hypothetical protein